MQNIEFTILTDNYGVKVPRIYMLRNGERDNDVYVETEKEKRTIILVVSDARFAFGVGDIAKNFDSISVTVENNSEKDYTITIKLRLQERVSALIEQKNTLTALLAKLNAESNSNSFYLNRTDFFNRQCEMFAKSCGLIPEVRQHHNQHDSSHHSNFAF